MNYNLNNYLESIQLVNFLQKTAKAKTNNATIFRFYQVDAFKACIQNHKGRVKIPTGGGKTPLEAGIIGWHMENSLNDISLVLSPRIILAKQLTEEYRRILRKGHIIKSGNGDTLLEIRNEYRFIAFHSGNHEPDLEKEQIDWFEINTTSVNELKEEYKKAQELGQKLVVFSTYHSSNKLHEFHFNTIIPDESQHLIQENFHESFLNLNGDNTYSFTATEKYTYSVSGRGHQNEKVYGPLLYEISAAILIKHGYICDIGLHIVSAESVDRKKTFINEVVEIYKKQKELSFLLGFSKVLYAAPGTEYISIIEDNMKLIQKSLPGVDIFTITDKTRARKNGNKISREEFLQEIKESKNCIVLHYDILTEGVDIDGITGVVIMRNMNIWKFIQTIGRATRIYRLNKELKKKAWVTVTNINNSSEDTIAFVEKTIRKLRYEGYDLSDEDLIYNELESKDHIKDEEEIDDAYSSKTLFDSKLKLEGIFHKIYEDEMREADEERMHNIMAAAKAKDDFSIILDAYF